MLRLEAYEWATDDRVTSYAVAGCLTVVVGMSHDHLLARIGVEHPDVAAREEPDISSGLSWVATASVPARDNEAPACVVIEDDDWQGVRPEVLSALSKRGKAASAFWNVEGMVMFGCARRGRVLATSELLESDADDFPRGLQPIWRAMDDQTDPVAVALAMVEKFTGVRLPVTAEVTAPSTWYPVTKPLLGLPVTAEELVGLRLPHRDLVEAVQAATPEARWRLAHWAAADAVEAAGLDDEDGVVEMLRQFGRPGPARLTPAMVTLRRTANRWSNAANDALSVEADHGKHDALKHWIGKYWAMEALAYTACDDDITAALGASYCASVRFRKQSKFVARAVAALEGG